MGSFILVGLALLVLFALIIARPSEPEVETVIIALPKMPPRSNPLATTATVIVVIVILLLLLERINTSSGM